jgi:outer membrane protein OmpA-like peptidoglycan-associated protein
VTAPDTEEKMTTQTSKTLAVAVAALALLAGCSTLEPSPALLQARSGYAAMAGSTNPANAEERGQAQAALNRANAVLNGGDPAKADLLAQIANAKVQNAQVVGQTGDNAARLVGTQNESMSIARAKGMAAAGVTAAATAATASTEAQIDREKAARAAAEARRQQALDNLKLFANVVEDKERGLVISIGGATLFKVNSAKFGPSANQELTALSVYLQLDPRPTVVEGHTDNSGKPAYNMKLSQERAKDVMDFLVAQGVSADRITSVGFGETRPIADNKTKAGRALNRRVDVVMVKATQ